MDNISLRGIKKNKKKNNYSFLIDYYNPSSCPGSPTLPDKLLSSASTATTLSPPGITLTASATSLASSSKRRGHVLSSGHRASYKRAHTGRSVSITNRIHAMKINKIEY
jgi:hypothetical protein